MANIDIVWFWNRRGAPRKIRLGQVEECKQLRWTKIPDDQPKVYNPMYDEGEGFEIRKSVGVRHSKESEHPFIIELNAEKVL